MSRRGGDFDDTELKQILELSRKTYEEEVLKRNQHHRSLTSSSAPRKSSAGVAAFAKETKNEKRSLTDDDLPQMLKSSTAINGDLINLRSADVATEQKIEKIKALMKNTTKTSPTSTNPFVHSNVSFAGGFTPTQNVHSSFSTVEMYKTISKLPLSQSFPAYNALFDAQSAADRSFLQTVSKTETKLSLPQNYNNQSAIVYRKAVDTPKIALSIPYLHSNGPFPPSNGVSNMFNGEFPSVSVNVAPKLELMKEFDPLMMDFEKLEKLEALPQPRAVSTKDYIPLDLKRKPIKERPLTLTNPHIDTLNKAFTSNKPSNGSRSRISGFNLDNLRLIERNSDVVKQLQEITSQLLNEQGLNDVRSNIWSQIIISPRIKYPKPLVSSVKLIVKCNWFSSPAVFTCDVCSTIEQITASQVLFELPPNSKVSLDAYALKVFALDEYFLPSSLLSDYAYVHNCIKLGKDIELQLVKLPSLQGPFKSCLDSIVDNNVSVKRDDISILLDTFKGELQKLEKAALSGDAAHANGVAQSVKIMCTILHKVQPLELIQCVEKLVNVCDSLVEDRKRWLAGVSKESSTYQPTAAVLQNLKRSITSVAAAVYKFLTAYSESSLVSFTLPATDESQTEGKVEQEIVSVEENLIIKIESLHNYPSDWQTTYEKFYLACYVFHGLAETSEMIKTEPAMSQKNFFDYLKFDSWITFDKTLLCILPRESRVCFVLFGTKVEIESESSNTVPTSGSSSIPVRSIVEVQLCWGTLPLFDFKNRLCQGSFFLSMNTDETIQPWGPKSLLANCNKMAPVLSVVLPSFSFIYTFPDVVVAGERCSRSFECLDVEQQEILEDIIEHGSILDSDEKDMLWEKRHYLIKKPEALPLVLKSAVSWDWACLSNIYQLLKLWTPLNVAQSLELLLPEFPDREVRAKAISWLSKSGSDQLFDILPQLTEALSFEVYENSALTKLLLEFAIRNRRFAFGLFWQLEERRTRNLFGCRCTLIQAFLTALLGRDFAEAIELQQWLLIQMDTVAVNVKQSKDSERSKLLYTHMTELDGKLLERHVHLPSYPSVIAVGVDWTKCKYFTSLTLPVKISFRTLNASYDVLHKVGDDLRQDSLVLEVIRLMDDLWLREGLDLRMIIYRCLSTGNRKGIIELVPDCKTMREIHVEEGGVTGALKNDSVRKWLQKQNISELDYLSALENFRRSCAGWCVGTFILGICDRHNDNIMITSRGHMFHIDFGKYLGDAQMFGSFKRDRTPFALTGDMVTVINGGSKNATTFFQDFVDACCKAFNIIRNNSALFVNLMKLMICSNIPGVNMDAVKYVCSNLWLDCSDNEASVRFTRMLEKTADSTFPSVNNVFHTLMQPQNKTFNEERLLSFVPKIYTQATDGRLKSVNVLDCEKWREKNDNKKIYMYKICVERVKVKVPSFIYRSYKEFCEFSDVLDSKFPLARLHGGLITLPHDRTLVRTNVRTIAERRRGNLDVFLKSLFYNENGNPDEISHSDVVYTFFHPILRDEQQNERPLVKTNSSEVVQNNKCSNEIKGELLVSVAYIKDRLEVMVHHARDLALLSGTVLPDTYVKCYLRPDRERRSKRKTRVVYKSVNPTYKETFIYRWPRDSLFDKTLELTVWRKGVLKENAFLGCVKISLESMFGGRNPEDQKINETWFRLKNKIS